jgi:hypothetical protein
MSGDMMAIVPTTIVDTTAKAPSSLNFMVISH